MSSAKACPTESGVNGADPMLGTGVLVRGVVHRLNNLLGAACGYAELLEMDRSALPDSSKEFLSAMVEAIEEAGTLGQQFLRFARFRDHEKRVLPADKAVDTALRGVVGFGASIDGTAAVCVEVNPLSLQEALRSAAALVRSVCPEEELQIGLDEADGGVAVCIRGRNCPQRVEIPLGREWYEEGLLFSKAQEKGQEMLRTDAALLQVVVQSHGGDVSSFTEEGGGCGIKIWLPASSEEPEGGGILP